MRRIGKRTSDTLPPRVLAIHFVLWNSCAGLQFELQKLPMYSVLKGVKQSSSSFSSSFSRDSSVSGVWEGREEGEGKFKGVFS